MGRFLIQIIQAENLKFVVYDDLCFFLNRDISKTSHRFLLNGPAHIQKNVCGQLRSPARTVYFGRCFADPVAALDLHMRPGAFVGYDGQSGREAATFLNGYLAIRR